MILFSLAYMHTLFEHILASCLVTVLTFDFRQGACTRSSCSIGKRCRKYHVLCGSVLSVWKIVESSLNEEGPGGEKRKMQIVRLKTSDDNKLVGKFARI